MNANEIDLKARLERVAFFLCENNGRAIYSIDRWGYFYWTGELVGERLNNWVGIL